MSRQLPLNPKLFKLFYQSLPWLFTLIFILSLIWWQNESSPQITLRVEDPYNITNRTKESAVTKLSGSFQSFDGKPSDKLTGSWPSFRGANHDNIATDKNLIESLSKEKVQLKWEQDLGEGYAGAAIANGMVYLIDYDMNKKEDQIRAFSMDDGREIWRRSYKVSTKRNHGVSRTVPAVNDKYLVTMGPKAHLLCVDSRSGDYLWGYDLVREFDVTVPLWYTGQCPLIDEGLAIIGTGGKALLVAIELSTGTIKWSVPNPGGYVMSHSSIIVGKFNGEKVYIYAAGGGIVGVSTKGKLLFDSKLWSHKVVAPSPVLLPDQKIFLTAGYGAGSTILKIEKDFSVTKVQDVSKRILACEQHTPILWNGHLYSVNPNDSGFTKRALVCMTLDGKLKWHSGEERFGLGPFLIADDKIFVLDDNGLLTMVRATSESYTKLGSFQALEGRESWGPMAIANGYLLVRDFTKMRCYNINEVK